MKISPTWLREFVDFKVDERTLATDLTMAGTSVESVSGEGQATVFEMEITTNRPDCMNHYGVARECSALYDLELKPIVPKLPAAKGKATFPIEIADQQGCGRYTARIVRGVTIKESPQAVKRRLEAMDARPIYNAADATNYNLIEMGHPTHAFDLDKLRGKIVVRRARDGEKLVTLDGVERTLTKDDLVIADAERAVALAGLMGGYDTMITDRTKNILIEAAWFDPVVIRKMARRLGMHTDASHRFERGADWGATPLAATRVAQFILEWAGGELEGDEIDVISRTVDRPTVSLRRSEVQRILGRDIPNIDGMLRRLGFGVTAGHTSQVEIPTWRLDVEREIDVIEEIARIHGYNRFPNTLPAFAGAVVELPDAAQDEAVRRSLLGLGYHEALSNTFISHADAKAFSTAQAVEIENPLNEEMSVMRTSLLPSMLNMLAYNLNRGSDSVRLFEQGKVYEMTGAKTDERKHACLGATGKLGGGVHQAARDYTFFDLKGDLETLLAEFQHDQLYFDATTPDYFHPGRSARAVIDGQTVARFGQLHPDVAAARKLKQDAYIAELYLDRLYQAPLRQPRYVPISRYPAVERDFSFLFPNQVAYERIRSTIAALNIAEMRSFGPVDLAASGQHGVPAGKYSMLLRAGFQSQERTLRDDEVAAWTARIVKALEAVGGTLRA